MLFGIEHPESREVIGVIRRSGPVDQCGHFCYVDVQVEGKKVTASGAEDRIYPFHSIRLDHLPKGGYPALGWCRDHNTYAFLVDGKVCEVSRGYHFREIEEARWQAGWRSRVDAATKEEDPRGEATRDTQDHQRDRPQDH